MIRHVTVTLFCAFYLSSCAAWFVKKPKPNPVQPVVEQTEPQPEQQPEAVPTPEPAPAASSTGGQIGEPTVITCTIC